MVGAVTPQVRASFKPQLNHEHSEARWWSWSDLVGTSQPELHPVVKQLLKEPARQQLAAALPRWGDVADMEDNKRHRLEKRGAGLLLVYALAYHSSLHLSDHMRMCGFQSTHCLAWPYVPGGCHLHQQDHHARS